MRNEYKRFLCD